MIGNIRGTIIDRGIASVLVECAGVGYEVMASSHTLSKLSAIGSEASLRIFTQFLDHKISLYGFSSLDERELFDLLITVKNVGPSSAIKILSAASGPVEIAQRIASRDSKALTKIKGIGKKTSEMLVVELHEKCEGLLMTWGAEGKPVSAPGQTGTTSSAGLSPLQNDVVMALVQLGFKRPQAETVVGKLEVDAGASLESVMRQALQAMPR